jgi:hypothetical protein
MIEENIVLINIIIHYLKTDMCIGYNSDTKEMRKRKRKGNGRGTEVRWRFCYLHVAPGNPISPTGPNWNLASRDANLLTVLGR